VQPAIFVSYSYLDTGSSHGKPEYCQHFVKNRIKGHFVHLHKSGRGVNPSLICYLRHQSGGLVHAPPVGGLGFGDVTDLILYGRIVHLEGVNGHAADSGPAGILKE